MLCFALVFVFKPQILIGVMGSLMPIGKATGQYFEGCYKEIAPSLKEGIAVDIKIPEGIPMVRRGREAGKLPLLP